jgi:Protein of unknown function (DUF2628)
LTEEEIAFCEYVGRKSSYYLERRRQMSFTGHKTSWNWAAFVFTVWWMFHRDMYLAMLVSFAAWTGLYVLAA